MSDRADELEGLLSGARSIGAALSAEDGQRLIAYLDELYSAWNDSAGLTRIARKDAVRLHLLDSLSLLPLLCGLAERRRVSPKAARSGREAGLDIVDLGSGAGLPGIPLAIALPPAAITLVDSRWRRCVFLEHACRRLALANCRVLHQDAETVAPAGEYDAVISRAFREPGELLRISKRLLRAGGSVFVMAAKVHRLETPQGFREFGRRDFRLPRGGESRVLREFSKVE